MSHRIAKAREWAGLSLGQAARMLGMDREVLKAIEEGPGPDDLMFARFARLYGCNIPWMKGEVPELHPKPAEELAIMCTRRGRVPSEKDKEAVRQFAAMLRSRKVKVGE